MDRLPEEKRFELMMMFVLIGLVEILLGIGVKRLLAAERAEVISLPLEFGRTGSSRGIDIHVANGVMNGCSHKLGSLVELSH